MNSKEYSNNEITILWKPQLCTHAGFCVGMLPQVFKPGEKPWIKVGNASTDDLMRQVSKCPSGALSLKEYKKKNIEIKQENNTTKGIFFIFENEMMVGKMTYVWVNESQFIIDHTAVDDEFTGKGYGKRLVFSAVKFARANGLKIFPLCPFAKVEFENNKNYNDVKF
jgi:uncharacterized protein